MKRLILLAAMLTVATTAAFADIAPEPGKKATRVKKPPVVNSNLEITLDSRAEEARLIIPASQLKQLRAELEQLDSGDDNTAALTTEGTFTRTQTIVSGIFLSLALFFGGMIFLRSGRGGRTAIGIVAAMAFGSAATVIYANIGPPPETRNITGRLFSQSVHTYGYSSGKIKLETGDGDRVRLIVPNSTPEAKPAGEK